MLKLWALCNFFLLAADNSRDLFAVYWCAQLRVKQTALNYSVQSAPPNLPFVRWVVPPRDGTVWLTGYGQSRHVGGAPRDEGASSQIMAEGSGTTVGDRPQAEMEAEARPSRLECRSCVRCHPAWQALGR